MLYINTFHLIHNRLHIILFLSGSTLFSVIVYSDCDELKDDYNLLLFFIFISLSVYCMVFN